MFQSSILDVATGLIVMYVVLALVCTSVMEYIAQVLGLRAEILWRSVAGLFQNSGKASFTFAKNLYDHALVNALSPPGDRPTNIPAPVFSLALVDALGLHTDANVNANSVTLVTQMLDTAKAANAELKPTDPQKIDEGIYRTLMPLAVAAGANLDTFRKNIESWYESAMQRASAWYKKRVQIIIFFVALSICLVFNADSLMLMDTLWGNPAATAALANAAKDLPRAAPPAASAPGTAKAPASTTEWINPNLAPLTTSANPTLSSPAVAQAQSQVTKLIGWVGPILPTMAGYAKTKNDVHRFPATFPEWLKKLLGILITAFAASLGAPFWFNVLGGVMAFRGGGGSGGSGGAVRPDRMASKGGN